MEGGDIAREQGIAVGILVERGEYRDREWGIGVRIPVESREYHDRVGNIPIE